MNIYEIVVFVLGLHLLNRHLNLFFMDVHYFLGDKASYLAVFIKYTFSEKKKKVLQHFKVLSGKHRPRKDSNDKNEKCNASFYRRWLHAPPYFIYLDSEVNRV